MRSHLKFIALVFFLFTTNVLSQNKANDIPKTEAASLIRDFYETRATIQPYLKKQVDAELVRKIWKEVGLEFSDPKSYEQLAQRINDLAAKHFGALFFNEGINTFVEVPDLTDKRTDTISKVMLIANVVPFRVLIRILEEHVNQIYKFKSADDPVAKKIQENFPQIQKMLNHRTEEGIKTWSSADIKLFDDWLSQSVELANGKLREDLFAKTKASILEGIAWLEKNRPLPKQLVNVHVGIAPDDIFQKMVENEHAEAFYDPKEKTMNLNWYRIILDLDNQVVPSVAIHEIQHARQDLNFDLQKRMKEALESPDRTRVMILKMIIEGDAMLTEMAFEAEKTHVDLNKKVDETLEDLFSRMTSFPPGSVQYIFHQTYFLGLRYVHHVWKKDGWQGVDRLFVDYPNITVQMIADLE